MNKAEGTQLQMGSRDLGQEACYLGQEARGANQLEKEAKSTQKEPYQLKGNKFNSKEVKSTPQMTMINKYDIWEVSVCNQVD